MYFIGIFILGDDRFVVVYLVTASDARETSRTGYIRVELTDTTGGTLV